jgi:hypothetical protein
VCKVHVIIIGFSLVFNNHLKLFVFFLQRLPTFGVLRILRDAGNRANLNALGLVKMAHAFGAQSGVDLIDTGPHENRLIGALRLTHIAIDALLGDHQGHVRAPRSSGAVDFKNMVMA